MGVLTPETRCLCAVGNCGGNNLFFSASTSALKIVKHSVGQGSNSSVFFRVCLLFQLSESSSSCSSIHSMDTTSSGMSSLINPLSSPPSCNNNPKIHKRSVSVTSITSTVLPPVYNQQNEDTCIIRISVEDNNGNMYKSIMVRRSDRHLNTHSIPQTRTFTQHEYVPNECTPTSPWVQTNNVFI